MKIFNFTQFLLEGKFLNSLYHFTDSYALKQILESNRLNISNLYDVKFKDDFKKVLSMTRNKNLKDPMRSSPIRIELDLYSIKYNNKVIPFDFFTHKNKDTKLKGDLFRKEPFEYEEILPKSIFNLNKSLISINFEDLYDLNNVRNILKNYLIKYNSNCIITYNDKIIKI